MATSVLFDEQIEIPLDIRTLADFRRWALSDDFPQQGRIDYISGRIEVDMAAEDFFYHGTLKTEMVMVMNHRVKYDKLGWLVSDKTRVSCPTAGLSAEPDIVVVSREAIASGRARLVSKVTRETGRYVEVEGTADLIAEIVSDSSFVKDTRRLPPAYYDAGVLEFWLVDARGEKLLFQIHRRGESGFEPVSVDDEGFQPSEVLGRRYRLERQADEQGGWSYDLHEEPL